MSLEIIDTGYVFLDIFIPLILLYVIFFYIRKRSVEVAFVRSGVNGREYLVKNLPNKQQAADTLAMLSNKLTEFVSKLQQKYPDEERVKRLAIRFNPNKISEGSTDSGYTTYTLNKGEEIVYCLRTKDGTNRIHRLNLLMFVSIHELAHIMTKGHGHIKEFQDNFKFLAEEAVNMGLYEPEDFTTNPVRYCGISVTSTPLGGEYFK